ncbi:hypothetical protein [Pseudomonas monsensis]
MSETDFIPPTPTEQASFDVGVLRALGNIVGALYKASPAHIREAITVQLHHDLNNPPVDWTEPHQIAAFKIPLNTIESVIAAIDQAELKHMR